MTFNEIQRFTTSMPENLLARFDELTLERGYANRSEALRDAIRHQIIKFEWLNDMKGERVGVLTVLYDPNKQKLDKRLKTIRNGTECIIQSRQTVTFDDSQLIDVFILRGDGKALKRFTEDIMVLEGVKYTKLTGIKPGDYLLSTTYRGNKIV
jgi:CopG family nickel-responsive transcriptional regulator